MNPVKAYVYPAYGVASFGKVAVEVTLQLYLFDFYTRILGLSPILAGSAFAVAILWDAVSDVVVSAGLFKARHHNIPYTLVLWVGAVLLALTTVLLFSPFPTGSSWLLFSHLLVSYVLVNTGMTLLDLPQSSLSAELSDQAPERNKLLASRMGFGILGLSVGSVLPGLLLADASGEAVNEALRTSRSSSAWVLAAIVLVSGTLTAVFLRARERETTRKEVHGMPSRSEVLAIFGDRPFMMILAAGVVAAVGRTINAALALMYYRFVLKLTEEAVTRAIFPVFTASIVLSIPLWIALARRYGKRRPAFVAIAGLGLMGIVAYPILPEGMILPPLLVSCLGGVLCGAVFLVDSMITDLIDADEAATGRRKEALYFAVWKSGLKVARAIAFVALGLGLEVIGLDLSLDAVPDHIETGITVLFGIVVGLCFLASGYLIRGAEVPGSAIIGGK